MVEEDELHILDVLTYEVELAVSHGYCMNRYFCLVPDNGCYHADKMTCHPLETIILGKPILNPINVDIAENLEVGLQWIDGFLDGYAKTQDSSYEALASTNPYRKSYNRGKADGHYMEVWIRKLESLYPHTNKRNKKSRLPQASG